MKMEGTVSMPVARIVIEALSGDDAVQKAYAATLNEEIERHFSDPSVQLRLADEWLRHFKNFKKDDLR